MRNIKLSFIVPMYNSEKYLNFCFDSLVNQDVPHEEYEIICVNDGSTDTTERICLEYKNKYSNIHYYEQENKGVSAARNFGLTKAQGEYIWFFDADDELSQFCLKSLLEESNNKNLDILEVNLFVGAQHSKKTFNQSKLNFKQRNEFENNSSVTKIVKRDILSSNSITFHEDLKYAEDYIWCLELGEYIKQFYFCTNSLYFYRENLSSVTRETESKNKIIKYSFYLLNILYSKQFHLKKSEIDDNVRALVWAIFMSSYSINDKKKIIDFLIDHGEYPYETIYISEQLGIFRKLFNYTPKLFVKASIGNLLVLLFRYHYVLILFFYIKKILIKDKNIETPILDMEEIERLYYGK